MSGADHGWRKGISWRDIEVRNEPGGKPVVGLRGGARDVVAQLGIREMLISISHCRSHATAYAIALGGPKTADEQGSSIPSVDDE